jgi:hypothetical protein
MAGCRHAEAIAHSADRPALAQSLLLPRKPGRVSGWLEADPGSSFEPKIAQSSSRSLTAAWATRQDW